MTPAAKKIASKLAQTWGKNVPCSQGAVAAYVAQVKRREREMFKRLCSNCIYNDADGDCSKADTIRKGTIKSCPLLAGMKGGE